MDSIKSVMEEIVLPPHMEIVGKKIVQIGYAKTAQILVIKRDSDYISQVGSTSLAAKDKLLILAEDQNAFSLAVASLKMDIYQND